MKYLITAAAVAAALLTVLSTRLLIPGMILVYRFIEAGFAPEEPQPQPLLAAANASVVVTEAPVAKKPRPARRRKPSAKTLARAAEALA